MTFLKNDLKASYDWELLETPIEIKGSSLQQSKILTPHPDLVTIRRDENYRLTMTDSGSAGFPFLDFKGYSLRNGETIPGEDIQGQVSPFEGITLHGVINTGMTRKGDGTF